MPDGSAPVRVSVGDAYQPLRIAGVSTAVVTGAVMSFTVSDSGIEIRLSPESFVARHSTPERVAGPAMPTAENVSVTGVEPFADGVEPDVADSLTHGRSLGVAQF